VAPRFEFTPHFVPKEDADMHQGAKGGFWSAFDDNHVPVLGPFTSREECAKAAKRDAKERGRNERSSQRRKRTRHK
jgi:hypothetical protein